MRQRAFENCKPFFVVPARPEDRNSCCCRQHVEIRMLFKTCMDYRRSIVSKDAERSTVFQVYDSLNELVDETLCVNHGAEFHKLECLERSCQHCGTKKFQLLPEESTRTNSFGTVRWQKFDYRIYPCISRTFFHEKLLPKRGCGLSTETLEKTSREDT